MNCFSPSRCLPMNLTAEDVASGVIRDRGHSGASLADVEPMAIDKSVSSKQIIFSVCLNTVWLLGGGLAGFFLSVLINGETVCWFFSFGVQGTDVVDDWTMNMLWCRQQWWGHPAMVAHGWHKTPLCKTWIPILSYVGKLIDSVDWLNLIDFFLVDLLSQVDWQSCMWVRFCTVY